MDQFLPNDNVADSVDDLSYPFGAFPNNTFDNSKGYYQVDDQDKQHLASYNNFRDLDNGTIVYDTSIPSVSDMSAYGLSRGNGWFSELCGDLQLSPASSKCPTPETNVIDDPFSSNFESALKLGSGYQPYEGATPQITAQENGLPSISVAFSGFMFSNSTTSEVDCATNTQANNECTGQQETNLEEKRLRGRPKRKIDERKAEVDQKKQLYLNNPNEDTRKKLKQSSNNRSSAKCREKQKEKVEKAKKNLAIEKEKFEKLSKLSLTFKEHCDALLSMIISKIPD